MRQGIRGVVNPISVPGILAAPGLALENWSGSEDAAAPWLERLVALAGRPEAETRAAFALPAGDRAAARRALLFDLRNLGTLGLQDDSFPGLLWSDAIYGRAELSRAAALAIPPMYAAAAVRGVLAGEAAAVATRPAARDAERIARGRAVFAERIVGTIANRQIFKRAPRPYAAAKLDGPVLAPIDRDQAAGREAGRALRRLPLGGAAGKMRPLADNPPPLGRCTHCHTDGSPGARTGEVGGRSTARCDRAPASDRAGAGGGGDVLRGVPRRATATSGRSCIRRAGCSRSTRTATATRRGTRPRIGAPAASAPSRCWRSTCRCPSARSPSTSRRSPDPSRPGRVGRARVGMSWVRAAPLVAVAATAPYLHNGSVPTLPALLEPAARRPVTFPLGAAGFVLDTRLPGNGNAGHEFGAALSAADKQDLIAFLESL